MSRHSKSSTVKVSLPTELANANPERIFSHMGISLQRVPNSDQWVISDDMFRDPRATESLVGSKLLANAGRRISYFDLLSATNQDEFSGGISNDRIAEEIRQIERFSGVAPLSQAIYQAQVSVASVEDSNLQELVQQWHEHFSNIRNADQEDELVFPNVATHWVSMNPVLAWRATLPAIFIRLQHDPQLSERLSSGQYMPEGQLMFASNHSLVTPSFFYGNYLGPLLACMSPYVWCAHTSRVFDSIIFSFGSAIPGHSPVPVDALDMLPQRTRPGPDEYTPKPESRQGNIWSEAIDWWAMRLNQLFLFLSDPATYQDDSGMYDPYDHQNWLMNTAELFERVTSALRARRDPYSALIVTFSALDLISDRFLGGNIGDKADTEAARSALDLARDSMPDAAAEILIPGAERAVAAVDSIADGFFLNGQTVRYTNKKGTVECTPREAVGPLFNARRNAVHGFGGSKWKSKGSHELLSQHRGDLPADISYLPYLYLLKILSTPESLRLRIERG